VAALDFEAAGRVDRRGASAPAFGGEPIAALIERRVGVNRSGL
jgi:hypothetical protein